MLKNFIISLLLVVSICTSVASGIFYHRLVEVRQQLNTVRVEYAAAQDKQSELRDIVRGTNEVLSESFNTLSGVRKQITAIRESYEKMENLLYNTGNNDSVDNNTTNLQN